jgi:hypothetical protein
MAIQVSHPRLGATIFDAAVFIDLLLIAVLVL